MSFLTRLFSAPVQPVAPVEAPKPARKPRSSTPKPASEASLIRQWAKESGIEVGERGRISAEVREAYAAKH